MRQLGETVVEGTITKWLKKEGESVERDEPLFEISTDKVDTEVPSPLAGKLVEIKVQEGETVQVGTELATIDTDGDGQAAPAHAKEEEEQAPAADEEASQQADAEPAPQQAQAEAEAPSQPEAGQPESKAEPSPAQEEAPPAPQAPAQGEEGAAQGEPSGDGGRSHLLSPLVRRLAEENQVDLSHVKGS